MKAIICRQWGTPDDLEYGDLPEPPLGSGQVRLAVKACALNFADTLMISGLYQEKPPFPFSPGLEAAGEIIELGEGVTHLQVGQRAAAICGHGGMAEQLVVDARMVMPIPDNMPYDHAASFAVAYGTSHVALAHRGQLQAGEVLLVHGAAGGVGLTAVEIGKQMGATVIATASSDEKLALTREYGADHTINYRETSFREQVKALTGGRGADVIFDPVGGEVFEQSLRCIAWEGRLLVIGFASGQIPKVPANYVLVKNCSIVGVYWGGNATRKPDVIQRSLQTLFGWYAQGRLRPHISRHFPLAEAPEAMKYLLSRQSTGKVVVTV